jgi:chromosome segregation ATPase
MAAEATITKELAFEVADKIEAGGKTPTLETLRAALAEATGTKGGSFATLAPILRAWKEQRSAAAAVEPLREAAPQVITDRLHGWATDVWSAALELANARLAAEREALDQARTKLETDVADGLALADRLSTERDELQARCSSLETELAHATGALAEEQTKFRAASASLEVCKAEAKQRQQQIDDLHRETLDARGERDQYSQQLQDTRQELTAKLGEITGLRADLATAQEARAHGERDLRAQKEVATNQREVADANLREVRSQLEQARSQAGQAREEAAALRGRAAAQEAQVAQLTAALAARQATQDGKSTDR